MADAAHAILTRPAREATGNCFSTTRCSPRRASRTSRAYGYGEAAGEDLQLDIFLDA